MRPQKFFLEMLCNPTINVNIKTRNAHHCLRPYKMRI